jgi:phospholipase/lecithinase/hemolysin
VNTFHSILASALLALAGAASAIAGPYSNLIVFGDSLSDVGNVKQSSFGLIPVSAYYQGRFSNGPVYAELLATALELGPLTHSRSGGSNFAHGNAQTFGNSDAFVLDVRGQVDQFLAQPTLDPNALFVVFAGANDLIAGQMDVNVPVGNLIFDIGRLIAAGAENLLVGNLPRLGLTPRFNGNPSQAVSMNAITDAFNAALASALGSLEVNEPEVNLYRFDVAQLVNDAVANPAEFGFSNVKQSAAPGLQYNSFFYNTNNIVPNPDSYLFWDDLHPTAAAHALLAENAFEAVTYSADFNFDGRVDGLDLSEWEAAYQLSDAADADGDGDSDGEDFLTWQRQYPSAVSTQFAAVPEPSSMALATLSLWLGRLAFRPTRVPVR